MPTFQYNKIVRDKVAPKIKARGGLVKEEKLSRDTFKEALFHKLTEEMDEFLTAHSCEERLEEAADLLEVILAILSLDGNALEDLEKARQKKHRERGGFSQPYKVLHITVPENKVFQELIAYCRTHSHKYPESS